ncbi:MAG: DUF262 domain-containing protein [Thermomicrobiales bacterium]|nr:DUF262 domain-containing protein [Thermomicrobiales bacterium]
MNASETSLQSIIEGTKQYVVPLFQRAYSWEQKEWKVLWEDLAELALDTDARQHFLGSIVSMPTATVPQSVAKYLLIDGQQRLTTILLLLAALRDASKSETGTLANEIDDVLLRNRYKAGDDSYKLLPTQLDRQAFRAVVEGDGHLFNHQITKAYNYFAKQIHRRDSPSIDALFSAIVARLIVVSITLDRDDDPHLIFESLNAKGRSLSQADLIRNYFFMRIPADRQELLYQTYWDPMQRLLGGSLTEFIRHFLMRKGTVVKQDNVYFSLKQDVDDLGADEVIDYLKELRTFANYYARLLDPGAEHRAGLRRQLTRIARLKVTVAYPFLLNLYADEAAGHLNENDLVDIIDSLVNLLVRRFVCGVARSGLNKEFPVLYSQAKRRHHEQPDLPFADAVRHVLTGKGYPRDAQFREHFTTARLYGAGDRREVTKLLLEELEQSFNHKEPVPFDNLTIEHVMPQSLTPEWRAALGDDTDTIHDIWLHTIGNLTLSGYNSPLSNLDFGKKRSILAQSHLEINRDIAQTETWDEAAIRSRAERLAERALDVWPYFGPDRPERTPTHPDGVTGTTPLSVTVLGDEYPVQTW